MVRASAFSGSSTPSSGKATGWVDPESPENLKRFLQDIEQLGSRRQYLYTDMFSQSISDTSSESSNSSSMYRSEPALGSVSTPYVEHEWPQELSSFRAKRRGRGVHVSGIKKSWKEGLRRYVAQEQLQGQGQGQGQGREFEQEGEMMAAPGFPRIDIDFNDLLQYSTTVK